VLPSFSALGPRPRLAPLGSIVPINMDECVSHASTLGELSYLVSTHRRSSFHPNIDPNASVRGFYAIAILSTRYFEFPLFEFWERLHPSGEGSARSFPTKDRLMHVEYMFVRSFK